MRSVVVVLPASMCAMIPMLRVLSSVKALGIWAIEIRLERAEACLNAVAEWAKK
jgi:hypothetical protein